MVPAAWVAPSPQGLACEDEGDDRIETTGGDDVMEMGESALGSAMAAAPARSAKCCGTNGNTDDPYERFRRTLTSVAYFPSSQCSCFPDLKKALHNTRTNDFQRCFNLPANKITHNKP